MHTEPQTCHLDCITLETRSCNWWISVQRSFQHRKSLCVISAKLFYSIFRMIVHLKRMETFWSFLNAHFKILHILNVVLSPSCFAHAEIQILTWPFILRPAVILICMFSLDHSYSNVCLRVCFSLNAIHIFQSCVWPKVLTWAGHNSSCSQDKLLNAALCTSILFLISICLCPFSGKTSWHHNKYKYLEYSQI